MTGWQHLTTANGIDIPVYITRPPANARAVLLLLPALGVRASFYRKLANGLAEHGIASIVMEQRGNGESIYRPGDGSSFSLWNYLDEDITFVTTWCKSAFENIPLFIGGHSLGGHMASLAVAAAPTNYAGVVHLACGFPYFRDFSTPASSFVRIMIAAIPFVTRIMGYFPGKWFGFGGREYGGLMLDWREWARSGSYDIPGFENAGNGIAAYDGPIISVAFDRDHMAPDKAVDRSLAAYKSANITRLKLGEAEQGEFLGHVNWGKNPQGVVAVLADWFATR